MRTTIITFVAYLAFFLLLLAQLPLSGALPGNTDTWLTIALSNTYLAELSSWLSGAELGSAMYPASDIHPYGEAGPLIAALFLLFRVMVASDVVAYYLFISTILALTAVGVSVLAHALTDNRTAAGVAGLAFACAGFTLGNIDDCIMVLWLVPAVALAWLWRVAHGANARWLLAAGALGGVQVYFSTYVFIYQSITLLIALLFFRTRLAPTRRDWLRVAAAAGIYLAVAAPMFAYYLWGYATLDVWTPPRGHEADSLGLFGLSFREHFQSLPGNLIYPDPNLDRSSFSYWIGIRSCAWPGVTLLLLASAGVRRSRSTAWLLTLAGIGAVLSWGEIRLGGLTLPPPAWLLERILPFGEFLRINSRAWFLVLLALVVLAGFGLSRILQHPRLARRQLAFAAAVATVMLIENVPVPLPAFSGARFAPPEYLIRLGELPRMVQADLPSRAILSFRNFGEDLFTYNREFIYLNWQSTHGQNTINGLNGYFPRSRLVAQKALEQLPNTERLRALGVERLVFHRAMVLPAEAELLAALRRSPQLRLDVEADDHLIFTILSAP